MGEWEIHNTLDIHMHALLPQSLYFSPVTLAFQPPIPQRYLNTFSAQLFTLLPALSLPLSLFLTHMLMMCDCVLKSLRGLLARTATDMLGPEGACRRIIHIDSIHKLGCSQLRKRLISLENRGVLCTHYTC